jgi:hypothetical protein
MGTTTNNGWTYPESTDLVKDGATAIQTLADDIDTTLGVYSPATPGLVQIGSTVTFSGVASVSLPNDTFTTTYDNYLILIDKVGDGGLDVNLRLRAAGVDDSSANYQSQRLTADNTTVSAARTANATSSRFDNAQTARSVTRLLISSPKLSVVTLFESLVVVLGATATPSLVTFVGGLNTSTAYDSLTVFCSGTITGTARVYGYAN